MSRFQNELVNFVKQFDQKAESYFQAQALSVSSNSLLEESKKYSFFSGGKRFRPFLSFLTAQSLNINWEDIFPILLATELVHTYSLIHDDLPCMDNDDFRRGQPTNHKKFGEDIALLAGDALLTDAFGVLVELKKTKPETILNIIKEFSRATGSHGMVSGQTWDMKAGKDITIENLYKIHHLKTGQLIQISVMAVALYAELSKDQVQLFKEFGMNLGLAFQIKDDLLDRTDNAQDTKSFPFIIGEEKTLTELNTVTQKAQDALAVLTGFNTQSLKMILDYNLERKK